MIQLITKNQGTMTSEEFAALIRRELSDGIIYGCEVTTAAGAISISDGMLNVCGMLVAITAESITPPSGSEIVIRVNADAATVEIITRAATALTQEDIYNGGSIYEVQLAAYTLSGTSVASAARTLPIASPANSAIYVQQAQPSNPSTGALWFW